LFASFHRQNPPALLDDVPIAIDNVPLRLREMILDRGAVHTEGPRDRAP
jgi:hypothetical protein